MNVNIKFKKWSVDENQTKYGDFHTERRQSESKKHAGGMSKTSTPAEIMEIEEKKLMKRMRALIELSIPIIFGMVMTADLINLFQVLTKDPGLFPTLFIFMWSLVLFPFLVGTLAMTINIERDEHGLNERFNINGTVNVLSGILILFGLTSMWLNSGPLQLNDVIIQFSTKASSASLFFGILGFFSSIVNLFTLGCERIYIHVKETNIH